MTRWRTRHRGTRSDRGAAAVEFAIVLVVLLLIIFAIVDFGRLLFVTQAMKSASREGARVAAVRGDWETAATNAGESGVALAADDNGLTLPPLVFTNDDGSVNSTATVCNATLADANVSVSVTATTDFKWLTPIGLLPGVTNNFTGTRPVSSTTVMRCE